MAEWHHDVPDASVIPESTLFYERILLSLILLVMVTLCFLGLGIVFLVVKGIFWRVRKALLGLSCLLVLVYLGFTDWAIFAVVSAALKGIHQHFRVLPSSTFLKGIDFASLIALIPMAGSNPSTTSTTQPLSTRKCECACDPYHSDHKAGRPEEFVKRESIAEHLECPVCYDPLVDPWTLSPCGHVVCFTCLRRWFNAYVIDRVEPFRLYQTVRRNNECPVCTVAVSRPTPSYIIRNLVEALGLGTQPFVQPIPSVFHSNVCNFLLFDGGDVERLEREYTVKVKDENGQIIWGGCFLQELEMCGRCGGPAIHGICMRLYRL